MQFVREKKSEYAITCVLDKNTYIKWNEDGK